MAKTNRDKFIGNMVDGHFQQQQETAEGKDREGLIAGKTGAKYGQAWDNIIAGEDDEDQDPPGPWAPPYDKEYRSQIAALAKYPEFRIHYMGLPGFSYRHMDTDPAHNYATIYELARHTRELGASTLRTFLMNGCRKRGERYMKDALPWKMVKRNGRLVIDFEQPNDYFYESCAVIEMACKYWGINHQTTMTMDRYNYDIYNRDNNVQGIHDYRSPEALEIKKKFIRDYLLFQMSFRGTNWRPSFEIENEPSHHGDWSLGKIIADQNLAIFRHIEDLVRIDELWTCSGSSEFSHANFVGPHEMIIDGQAVIFGSPEFQDRRVKPEFHGTSTKSGLVDHGWSAGLGSGWMHLASNEDGGSKDGNYNPIPWTSYRQGDYGQLLELCLYAISTARAKNKTWYFTAFMMDCLEQDTADENIPKETYDLDDMDWHRPEAYGDARAQLGY